MNTTELIILMVEYLDTPVLAGSSNGQRARIRFCEQVRLKGRATILYLDFEGVDVSTGSFLREAIFELRDELRKPRYDSYLVVANASKVVVEDLEILIESRRDVLVLCDLQDVPSNHRLLGDLESKQQFTFELLRTLGSGDAKLLMKHDVNAEVSRTAWSNRLSSLSKLGLIIEEQRGRLKWYSPLFLGE